MDEKGFVESSLLRELKYLNWEIIKLEKSQLPSSSYRENFSEVILKPKLKEALKEINNWLEDDQIEYIIHTLTSFDSNSLIKNNKKILEFLINGIVIDENRKTKEISPIVKIIDFEEIDKNNFIAISQLKVKVKGKNSYIEPDIVCFLNGLPIAVIEAKSPKANHPIDEAINDLFDYAEVTNYRKNGNRELFYYNQFLIASDRNHARYGTITTQNIKHFYSWLDPYPLSLNDIKTSNTSPNEQQRLIAGIFNRENLLKIIENFIVFSSDERGREIKIAIRYQQFKAVELIIKRLLKGKNKKERGGIIWHTQGSGKSLTMMFSVRRMYKIKELAKWKVVFITDRSQLETQLANTSQGIGYKVKVANSIKTLKEYIKNTNSDLVMGMIHKFQDRREDFNEIFPILNKSENILIMIDEAHRTQYSLLGANLDRSMPNATKIAYSGTPIAKTERTFGTYIDTYSMRKAIRAGVTLEIVYEGRTNSAEISDKDGLNAQFEDIFSDYNLKERLKIIGYGSKRAYLEAKEIIKAKAKDMVKHYVTQIFPNGFKAQVVAISQEGAVRYKEAIDEALSEYIKELQKENPLNIDIELLKNIKSDVVLSGNKSEHINKFANKSRHKRVIEGFKKPFGNKDELSNIAFIIVNDMLLTGFDAPIEQVIYLDRVMKGANLLQALARVNRVGNENKLVGFIVDYVGVGQHLKEAIESYDAIEERIDSKKSQKLVNSFKSFDEEIRELKLKIKDMREFISTLNIKDLSDLDDMDKLDEVCNFFYDDNLRFIFSIKYKALARAFSNVLPKKEALEYLNEFKKYHLIYIQAKSHFRDNTMSFIGIPQKLRALTDEYLKSMGIDIKVKPISIIDKNFHSEIGKKKSIKSKAIVTEHAIREYIDLHSREDEEKFLSFHKTLEEILEKNRNNWEEIFKALEELREQMTKDEEPTYGLNKRAQMPIFRILKNSIYDRELNEDELSIIINLTKEIFLTLKVEIALKNFWSNISAQKVLIEKLNNILINEKSFEFSHIYSKSKDIINKILEFANSNCETILGVEL